MRPSSYDRYGTRGLEKQLEAEYGLPLPIAQWLDEDDALHEESLRERIVASIQSAYDEKAEGVGAGMRQLEKQIMLQVLDAVALCKRALVPPFLDAIHHRDNT